MRRWSPFVLCSLLVVGLALAPRPARAADAAFHFTPGALVTFQVSGGGHGVGMSQWGARGRALAGQDADQILAAYYTGTTVVTQGDDHDVIRVLLPNDALVAVPFGDYLASVVSSELPPNWPMATLQAQAIASRTYARWNLTPDRPFDLMSTVQSQVYGATARADAIAAVTATAGQVVTYQGQLIPAYFHACSPTWTANNEDVWPGPALPYLRGVDDVAPDGHYYGADCPYARATAGPFSTELLSRLLAANPATAVGNLKTLVYGPRDAGGRLLTVTLQGDAGTKTVSANTFRSVISSGQPRGRMLLSADFQVVPAAPGAPAPPPVAPQPSPNSKPTMPSTALPATPSPTAPTAWVLTTHADVALLSAPQPMAPIVAHLPPGAPLQVLGTPAHEWLPVRVPANGNAGYVATADVAPWQPGSASVPAPTPPANQQPPSSQQPSTGGFAPFWVENFARTQLWSGVDGQAISFGPLAQWSPMLVLAPAVNGRYLVRVWRTGGEAYVDGAVVGPAGAPADAS